MKRTLFVVRWTARTLSLAAITVAEYQIIRIIHSWDPRIAVTPPVFIDKIIVIGLAIIMITALAAWRWERVDGVILTALGLLCVLMLNRQPVYRVVIPIAGLLFQCAWWLDQKAIPSRPATVLRLIASHLNVWALFICAFLIWAMIDTHGSQSVNGPMPISKMAACLILTIVAIGLTTIWFREHAGTLIALTGSLVLSGSILVVGTVSLLGNGPSRETWIAAIARLLAFTSYSLLLLLPSLIFLAARKVDQLKKQTNSTECLQ